MAVLALRSAANLLQHRRDIVDYGIDWESKDDIAHCAQPTNPFGVVISLIFVDASIELYCEAAFRTAEISDEWANWVLATELEAVELAPPDGSPQQILRWSLAGAQFTCSSRDFRATVN